MTSDQTEDNPAAARGHDQEVAEPAGQPPLLGRNRDFNLLWGGQAVSALGSEISEIAYPLLVLAVTGSAAKAGLVGACLLIAQLLTLLPAGLVADRYPRKRILVISSVAQLGAVGTVPVAILAGHVYLAHLAAVGAVQGAASAFYLGASRGAIRRIVPVEQLSQAMSRTQARDQAATLIGPTVGGTLFGVARFLPFAGDALSFGAIALAAAALRGPVDPPLEQRASRPPQSTRRALTRGLRYVSASPYLRTVAIWAAAINAVAAGLLLMLVVIVRYRGGGPTTVGVAISAGAVGGLIGSLLSARLSRLLPGRRLVLTASWVLGPAIIAMAITPWRWIIGFTAALAFLVIVPANVVLLARFFELTPHDMQAQAGNALTMVASCMKWAGPPVFGLLADGLGPVTATLIGAALYLVIAAWLQTRPALRQLSEPAQAGVG